MFGCTIVYYLIKFSLIASESLGLIPVLWRKNMTTNNNNNNLFANPLVFSSVKGNLTKDPVGPFTSANGREYMAFSLAVNNWDNAWFPRVFLFGDCMNFGRTLKNGDFIELTNEIYNPSEMQDPYIDKNTGEERKPSAALMVFSQRTSNGTTVPIRMLKAKPRQEEKIAQITSEAPTEVQTNQIVEAVVSMDSEEQQVIQALQTVN